MFVLEYPWLMFSFAIFVIRRRPQWIVVTDTNRLFAALPGSLCSLEYRRCLGTFPFVRPHDDGTRADHRRLAGTLAQRVITLTDRDTELYVKHYSKPGRVAAIPNIVGLPTQGKAFDEEVLAVGRFFPQRVSIYSSRHGALPVKTFLTGLFVLWAKDPWTTSYDS